jgi:hypothetical protein
VFWRFEIDALPFLLFSLLHPAHCFFHAFLSQLFILFHFELKILMLFPELSSDDLSYLLSVLHADIFQIFFEGCELVLFVEVDSIVDELDEICVEVHSFVFLFFCLVVDVLDDVVMFLII